MSAVSTNARQSSSCPSMKEGLQEVAHREYPHAEKECARQRKKKIMGSIPLWFVKQLEKEDDMKVMLYFVEISISVVVK